ncbi:MAG: bifunctional 4-hydroxy-2-oxoglutarate aldolase/2-dehydro-3-deoxy-phosphogluconate aldolase [Omnitrophica bacterium]|nr:bifunctional 4-hydroxy-2-oxoglutarate aldolase/2-dehydro-3-deoxy-phosphogluconate aldolase [Candidatus Omnitrophota bacterium]
MNLTSFRELPIMGILRGIKEDMVSPLVEVIVSSGLGTIEITMNTSGAAKLIQASVKAAQGRLMIGAGTVLTMDDLHRALDSGASFIVLPVLVEEVVEYCLKKKIPVFPGALTPQEIYRAWCLGATMVKVFPAKFFGAAYFKELKGPFEDIGLLACGGITAENVRSFFSSGASAVAFGGSIFKRDWLEAGDFSAIGESIKALIAAYKQ